ncbi:hypothetical protein [Sphingomonas sp. DC1100-1]|uniref:hypothetical protein n=1 Tax=unclassified Sphingomonas TaxID=196159 RepID=UPI003CF31123
MELGSLPVWAQQLGGLILTLATAVALTWNERRKAKAVPVSDGAAEVVAASFVDKRLLERLIEAVAALNGNVVMLNGHVEKINERMHEDEIVRAAVARMKEGRQ